MLCVIVSKDKVLIKTFSQKNQFTLDRNDWVFPTSDEKGQPILVFRAAGIAPDELKTLGTSTLHDTGSKKLVLSEGLDRFARKYPADKKTAWAKDVGVLQGGYALVPLVVLPTEMKNAAQQAIASLHEQPITRRIKKDAA